MKTLKYGEISQRDAATVDNVRRLSRFIEEHYNRRPLHLALGHRPQEEFETMKIQLLPRSKALTPSASPGC